MEPPPNYLDWLPDETLLNLLLQTDDLGTLARLCQTNRRIAGLCRDKGFWNQKYHKDYQDLTPLLEGDTWRKRYQHIYLSQLESPISAGFNHYSVIDKRGILYMGGWNVFGQLGNGSIEEAKNPTVLFFKSPVINVSSSYTTTGAITNDGKVFIWGTNSISMIPKEFSLGYPHKAVKIVLDPTTFAVLLDDHSIHFRGKLFGKKYDLKMKIKAIDIAIGGIIGPMRSIMGARYAAIDVDGQLYRWGHNLYGYFHKLSSPNKPIHVPLPELASKVIIGKEHIVVLSTTGNVYTWGMNIYGQLGLGRQYYGDTNSVPTKVIMPELVSSIAVSDNTTAVITISGRLFVWGEIKFPINNFTKQHLAYTKIGTNDILAVEPIEIEIGSPVNYVSIGYSFMIAVTKDGYLNYWGDERIRPE